MADLKLIELAEEPWEGRWKTAQELAKEADLNIEVENVKVEPGTLKETIETVLKSDAEVCHVHENLGVEILGVMPSITRAAISTGATDFLVKDKGYFWPRKFLEGSATRIITSKVESLDLGGSALVVGCGALTRLMVGCLTALGFRKIHITDQDNDLGESVVAELEKAFFGVEFKYIPVVTITTLPGTYSLVINTTPLVEENLVLDELYFFNFLKETGLIVDMTYLPYKTPLILESSEWNLAVLSGEWFVAKNDTQMIQSVTGVELDLDRYVEGFRKECDAVKIDIEPFIKRFRERSD